jgi:hypothetical protein
MFRRLFAMAESIAVKRMKTSSNLIGTHKSASISPTLRRNANQVTFAADISMQMKL